MKILNYGNVNTVCTKSRHKWTSEGCGGCKENPGVWSIGGTAILCRKRCVHCGLIRSDCHAGSNRNAGEARVVRMYSRALTASERLDGLTGLINKVRIEDAFGRLE